MLLLTVLLSAVLSSQQNLDLSHLRTKKKNISAPSDVMQGNSIQEKVCFGRLAFSKVKTCLKHFQVTLQMTDLNFSFIPEFSNTLLVCMLLCIFVLLVFVWFVVWFFSPNHSF